MRISFTRRQAVGSWVMTSVSLLAWIGFKSMINIILFG
ncbi:hypothetical protein BDA96_06G126000 [Sorghum bicolor]|uniref:Uncharacterized protein n=1 Tax=Sorghum bicolor TaxID=4558 RepID=A0A921UBR5_SORBI|nr:hypothetical protein BDA96_06G126000 [Sorghum bicolor]